MSGPIWEVEFEYRAAADGEPVRIAGILPYAGDALIANGGRLMRERITPGALEFDDNVLLTFGHDRFRPLASTGAGSLELRDSASALSFVATLPEEREWPSWTADAVKSIRAGLMKGLSPVWHVRRHGGQRIERTRPLQTRHIEGARLVELGILPRGAYTMAEVEARAAELQASGASDEALRWL